MKKFIKYTALTALVLTILGVVLLSVGVIGGSVQGIKTLDVLAEKIKAGELSIDAEDIAKLEQLLEETGTSVEEVLEELEDMGVDIEEWFEDLGIKAQYNIEDNIRFVDGFEIFEGGSLDLTIDGTEASKLSASLSGSEIEFKTSSDGNFHVKADYIGKMQAFVKDDTFHLIGSKTGVNVTTCDIVLEVPEGAFFENAELNVGAGSVDLDSMQIGSLKVSVGAGDFHVNSLVADEVILSVGAGDATIEDGTLGYIKAEVGAGSIDINATITGDIDADVALGDLDITVKGSTEKDHNYKLDCAMGDMQVGSYSWSGIAGSDVKFDNGAATTYDLNCAMGSLNVRFTE